MPLLRSYLFDLNLLLTLSFKFYTDDEKNVMDFCSFTIFSKVFVLNYRRYTHIIINTMIEKKNVYR